MKPIIRNLISLFFGIAILLILNSCASIRPSNGRNVAVPNLAPIFTPTLHAIRQVPTETNTAVPSTATLSPLPPVTLTPPPTYTPALSPTWTVAPTLSRQEARALVQDLLENNGGCRLPCWWGIVPGQTDWNTARHFLETFVTNIEQGGEGQMMKNGVPVYVTNYGISYEGDIKGGFLIDIEGEIVAGFETGWDRTQKRYHLQRLLTDYGPPDEIFVGAQRYSSTGDPPPFYILLNYKDENFLANYEMDRKLIGEKLAGCPQLINPVLWLWSPDEKWTPDEIYGVVYGDTIPGAPKHPLLSLKEATGMDIVTFTAIFKDPASKDCIETPAELWP